MEYCIVSSQSRKLRSQKCLTIPVGTSEVSSLYSVYVYAQTSLYTYYRKVNNFAKEALAGTNGDFLQKYFIVHPMRQYLFQNSGAVNMAAP